MTPDDGSGSSRARRRSHHACLNCRFVILQRTAPQAELAFRIASHALRRYNTDAVGLLQEEEDPLPGREAGLFKLRSPQAIVRLSDRTQIGTE
jgi:hypothetical protein